MDTKEWLQRARVASPCHADWDSMEGDEQVRFCRLCKKNVYNFSALALEEIAGLIRGREGKICARFYRRRDGTILTADCPVGHRRRRRGDLLGLCVGAFSLLAVAVGLARLSGRTGTGLPEPARLLSTLQLKIRALLQPQPARCGSPLMGKVVMGEIYVPTVQVGTNRPPVIQ